MVDRAVRSTTDFRCQSPGAARGLLVFAMALMGLVAYSASPSAQSPAPVSVSLANVEQRTVIAKNGAEYRVFIVKPKSPPPASGYPVLYALDGNSTLGFFSNLSAAHIGRDDLSGFVPGLIVSIGYPADQMFDMRRRSMDYTPHRATPDSGTYLKPEYTGGADAFLAFLEHELKPAIERDFKINAQKQALYGHSFGGLFTLHVLFTKPALFQTYIAASPSIWWADRGILQSRDRFLEGKPQLARKRLLILVGGLEQELAPHQAKAKDAAEIAARLKARRMVSDARDLRDGFAPLAANGLQLQFEEVAGESHNSVIPYSVIKAFRFAFSVQ